MGRLPVRSAAPLLLVLGAVVLAYLPSLSGGRVWDDTYFFERNAVIAGSAPAWQAFREPYIAPDSYYRPLTVLALRGLNAAGGGMLLPKLLGLCLHLGLTAFVCVLARRLGAGSVAALAAAALFGLHPALTEAVAWVSSLGDLLAAAWLGGATVAVMRAIDREDRAAGAEGAPRPSDGRDRRWAWTALSLLCFLVALLCKETAAVFPVITAALLVGDRLGRPAKRAGSRMKRAPAGTTGTGDAELRPARTRSRLIVLFAGQAAVLVAWFVVRSSVLQADSIRPIVLAPIGMSLRLALLGRYVALLFWPAHLNLLHVIDPPAGGGDLRVWLGVFGLLAFLALAAWTVRRRPAGLAPAAWAAAMLAPALILIPEGTGLLAERYLYLPGIGLAVLLGIFASAAASGMRGVSRPGVRSRPAAAQRILLAAVGVIAVVFFGLVVRRSYAWRSQSALFQQALNADSRAATAAVKLGFAMRQAGHRDEALALYERTLQAVAAHPPVLTDLDRDSLRKIAYEAGLLRGERGDLPEAERALRLALQYDPTDERSLGTLGALLGQTGRYGEARAVLETGVGVHPESKLIRRNLAVALGVLGDSSGAAAQYREILRQDPGDQEAAAALQRSRGPGLR